eukprot:scaffold4232_cov51-Attheya_sp.AAC.1
MASLDFDAIKMATQVTLDRLISNLRLEMIDNIGEKGGIPRCGKGAKCVGEECVMCEEKETYVHETPTSLQTTMSKCK